MNELLKKNQKLKRVNKEVLFSKFYSHNFLVGENVGNGLKRELNQTLSELL